MKPNRSKIIGITGGIATGKTTVSNILREAGYRLIDADQIAREIMSRGSSACNEVVDTFGSQILREDGSIDRRRLGHIIFASTSAREKLNRIVHPHIFDRIGELLEQHRSGNGPIFLDIPLLIEEMDEIDRRGIQFHEIWLVYADEVTQLNRLMERDDISRAEGIRRLKAQMPIEAKRKYATRIIDNRGNIEMLHIQMTKIIDEII